MIITQEEFRNLQPDCSVVIVGSGAAGSSAALELASLGRKVLLIEAGTWSRSTENQQPYIGEVTNPQHAPLQNYRSRRMGGTTDVWGGRCVPYDPIDFEKRDHVPFSGWPFSKTALDPFYARAHRWLKIGEYDYDARSALRNRYRPMIEGFHGEVVDTDNLERYTYPMDFGRHYKKEFFDHPDIFVLLETPITRIQLSSDGKTVAYLESRDGKGSILKITADRYVLATGCLEVTRLLMVSNDVAKNGIGNHSGLLGKFYMSHLSGTIGHLKIKPEVASTFFDYEQTHEGVYCRKRLVIRAEAQMRERTANFAAWPQYPEIQDPSHRSGIFSSMYLAKNIRYVYNRRVPEGGVIHGQDNWKTLGGHVRNIILGFPQCLKYGARYVFQRILATNKLPGLFIPNSKRCYALHYHVEQVPTEDSRVELGDSCDSLGMRRLKVSWKYCDLDIDSIVRSYHMIKKELESQNVGTLEFDEAGLEAAVRRQIGVGGHHIGTTRMSVDPNEGVTDPDCRIHGIDNLYIASSAVFPTSGQANPTLTIAAIAMLVADRVHQSLDQ